MTKSDAVKAWENDGRGTTNLCAGAICTVREADKFPHPVTGYLDWFTNRVFVSSKQNANNFPCECYLYAHKDHMDEVFDLAPQKLIDHIEKQGGKITLYLYPPPRTYAKKPSVDHGSGGGGHRKPRGHELRAARMG